MDSNYPQTILAACALTVGTAERLRNEGLEVKPTPEVHTLEVKHGALLVPDFTYLSGELFRASVTEGGQAPIVAAYLDSVVEFAEPYVSADYLHYLRPSTGSYESTETKILQTLPPGMSAVDEEQGLRLVREACEHLEKEV